MAIGKYNWLGVTDYVIIVITLVICVAIGWFNGRKRQMVGKGDAVSEFLLGSRAMALVPVAISATATWLSPVSITGRVGEMYRYGIMYILVSTTAIVAKVVMSYAVLPVYHQATYTSVYEFLEKRYDKTLRRIASARYILTSCYFLGIVLYLPSISVSAVSGLPYWSTVLAAGLICIVYCVMGGFRAVVWTDVFQAFLIYGSMTLLSVVGIIHVGGVNATWAKAFNGTDAGKITLVETETTRYSIWGIVISGFVSTIYGNVGSQIGAQRVLCVKDKVIARRSYLLAVFFALIFKCVVITFALVVLAAFSRCDPVQISQETGVTTNDHIYIYAVTEFVGQYPGMIGISLVALISASLSTFSSYLSALSAITLEDFLKPFFPKRFSSDRSGIVACKVLTAFYGLLATLTSFSVPWLGGAIKSAIAIRTSTAGAMAGIALVGMFSRHANTKACKVALALSLFVVIFLAVVSLTTKTKYDTLPHTTTECPNNFTIHTRSKNSTAHDSHNSSFLNMFKISFMWFNPIGFAISTFGTLLLSYVIGTTKTPDESLSSPWRLAFRNKKKIKTEHCDSNGQQNNLHLKVLQDGGDGIKG